MDSQVLTNFNPDSCFIHVSPNAVSYAVVLDVKNWCRPSLPKPNRPNDWRPLLYGYALTIDKMRKILATRKLGPHKNYFHLTHSVINFILREAGLGGPYAIECEGKVELCIGIAHSKTWEGMDLATPERTQRVKRAMEVE